MPEVYCEHLDDVGEVDESTDVVLSEEGAIRIGLDDYVSRNPKGSDPVERYIESQEDDSVEAIVCICPYCQQNNLGRSYFIVDENIDRKDGLDFIRLRKSEDKRDKFERDKSDPCDPLGLYAVRLFTG